MFQFADSSGVE